MQREIKHYLLEAAFVVTGVMLGLFGNEWREGAKKRNHAESVRQTIIEEIKINRDEANRAISYHLELMTKSVAHGHVGPLIQFVRSRSNPRWCQFTGP